MHIGLKFEGSVLEPNAVYKLIFADNFFYISKY